jgi:hypothetical protein
MTDDEKYWESLGYEEEQKPFYYMSYRVMLALLDDALDIPDGAINFAAAAALGTIQDLEIYLLELEQLEVIRELLKKLEIRNRREFAREFEKTGDVIPDIIEADLNLITAQEKVLEAIEGAADRKEWRRDPDCGDVQ